MEERVGCDVSDEEVTGIQTNAVKAVPMVANDPISTARIVTAVDAAIARASSTPSMIKKTEEVQCRT